MSIFLACSPILLLIVLLIIFKISGDKGAILTLILTALVALFAFHQPISGVSNAFLLGSLKAIFPILFIIVMAIYSYNVLLKTEKIEVIKQQFSSISSDKTIQVLLITWGFGGLLEGMAGFGTAVAIPAAILISLGYKPLFSAVVSLIANSVPTAFGGVGVPVLMLSEQAGVANIHHLSINVVMQLSVMMFLVPLIIAFLTDRSKRAFLKNIILSLIIGGISLVVQYIAAAYIGVQTPAILGSLASIAVIILMGQIFKGEKSNTTFDHYGAKETFQAWSVYLFVIVLIIFSSSLFPGIKSWLSGLAQSSLNFHIDSLVYQNNEFVPQIIEKSWKVSWLTLAGFPLFIGSFLGGLIQGGSVKELITLLGKTVVQLKATFITLICLVGLSSIMEYSGMVTTIALALASATGEFYPLFAPLVGSIGTFVTGSDTSSNILFGKLQADVATSLSANGTTIDPSWLAAANTTGATGGKIISPQSIAIATSACDQQGQEGNILLAALPYAGIYIVVTGIMVYMFA